MSWQDAIRQRGGDPALYEAALAKVGANWSRPDARGEECAYLMALTEAGVIEIRRVDLFRDNGTWAGSHAEFRRPK